MLQSVFIYFQFVQSLVNVNRKQMHIFAEPRGPQFSGTSAHMIHDCTNTYSHVLLHTHTAGGQKSLTLPQQLAEVAEGV